VNVGCMNDDILGSLFGYLFTGGLERELVATEWTFMM
jgi:hypothetical protein